MTSLIVPQRLRLIDMSIFADHSNSEVVNTQGESAMRLLTITFSALLPSTSQLCKQLELSVGYLELLFSSTSSRSRPSLWCSSGSRHQTPSAAARSTHQQGPPCRGPPDPFCKVSRNIDEGTSDAFICDVTNVVFGPPSSCLCTPSAQSANRRTWKC